MDRRTFVLLTGAASAAGLGAPARRARAGPGSPGRLRFELDDQRRWSLWYYGGDAVPVAVLRGAELVARLGDQPCTLAQLEDSTVGNRRPPGGDAIVVRGRAAGVWVEAEFLAGDAAAVPQAAITLTLFPDRYLPTVNGARFFQLAGSDLLPGDGSLTALVNGYDSRDRCGVVAVGAADSGALISHGALGLVRGGRGLGLAFDAGEPGEAELRPWRDGFAAVTDWLPSRPLRPGGDASRLRVAYQPDGDALDALHAAFVPASPLDLERMARAVAPAGWRSRYALGSDATEAALLANAAAAAAHLDRRFLRYIQLDDGYQKAAGDWATNERFPHGHRWLTDQIHGLGFKAGLWVAPFAVAERSGVPAAHPEWLLQDATGPIAWTTRAAWGGKVFALDAAHPKVQQWLFDLARTLVREWGYDAVECDWLRCATLGGAHYGGLTHAEAYRAGLTALRDGLGTEAALVACGAPLQHAAGLVNAMRSGPDAGTTWGGIEGSARAAGLRSFYHRAAWLTDPDSLVVGSALARGEAEAWAAVVALAGGATWCADELPALAPERLALLRRTLPVAAVAGRPVAALAVPTDVASAIVCGDVVSVIRGPWRFRTGDDPAYGTRVFDEEAWETVSVPSRWGEAGHPDYEGVAWYRVRFGLPPLTASERRAASLALGKVAVADQTFLNGVAIGQTGEFPPSAHGDERTFRRYAVPTDLLNWGGENVLAVRVYAGPGLGGIWSLERDRPPQVWVAEGAARWWTVAGVNWDDAPAEIAVPLRAAGIVGAQFDAYDVWQGVPLAAASDPLPLALGPRSARVVALRAALARPQVIGTTRHVVQGAVDIADEAWDAATRTLEAKAVNLDGSAYAVTIAVPSGLGPASCQADVACTVRRLASGHAVLAWPAGGDGRDIKWQLRFRPARPKATRRGP